MNGKIIKLSLLFRAMSDANRLKIIHLVHKKNLRCKLDKSGKCEDQACMKFLSEHLKIGFPTISHHVKELVSAGIVKTKKEGRWSHLQINPKKFDDIITFLKELRTK